ncbi:hypothetical protein AGMMS49521_1420 [Campylobacterota bacterium]|nr:hypothetical protein AGMMS49521_1420 [Campylobacterota bacterium]
MLRAVLLLALAFATAFGDLLIGGRIGGARQTGSYDGESSDSKIQYGFGGTIGYQTDSFRVVGGYEAFSGKGQSEMQLATIGLHAIDAGDPEMRGYLGVDLGQLNYRHSNKAHLTDSSMNVAGLAVGFILYDSEFPSAQMDLGFRYLRTFGNDTDKLDVSDLMQIYLGLSFNLW